MLIKNTRKAKSIPFSIEIEEVLRLKKFHFSHYFERSLKVQTQINQWPSSFYPHFTEAFCPEHHLRFDCCSFGMYSPNWANSSKWVLMHSFNFPWVFSYVWLNIYSHHFLKYHILETDLAAKGENPIGFNRNKLVDENVNEMTNLFMPASDGSDWSWCDSWYICPRLGQHWHFLHINKMPNF